MNREIILVLLAELHQFCEKGFLFNPGANIAGLLRYGGEPRS
jgi:hypothetical protein